LSTQITKSAAAELKYNCYKHLIFTCTMLDSTGISCRHVSLCLSQVDVLLKRHANNAAR